MRTASLRVVMMATILAASCTGETTSFRSTDRVEPGDSGGAGAAIYEIPDVARVHVWSTGGFIGRSEDPMTQLGIQIDNVGERAVVFDSEATALAIFDETGRELPAPSLTSVVPLGPALITIAPATSATFDVYFRMTVRPPRVASMRARWVLLAGKERITRTTSFVRDDDAYPFGLGITTQRR